MKPHSAEIVGDGAFEHDAIVIEREHFDGARRAEMNANAGAVERRLPRLVAEPKLKGSRALTIRSERSAGTRLNAPERCTAPDGAISKRHDDEPPEGSGHGRILVQKTFSGTLRAR